MRASGNWVRPVARHLFYRQFFSVPLPFPNALPYKDTSGTFKNHKHSTCCCLVPGGFPSISTATDTWQGTAAAIRRCSVNLDCLSSIFSIHTIVRLRLCTFHPSENSHNCAGFVLGFHSYCAFRCGWQEYLGSRFFHPYSVDGQRWVALFCSKLHFAVVAALVTH